MATEAPEAVAASPEQVETAFLGAMDALDSMLVLQHQLSIALKQGWLNLSRARYHLGAFRVGPLQYPSTMVATAKLAVGPGAVEENARSATEVPMFSLMEQAAATAAHSMEDLLSEEAQDSKAGLGQDAWAEGLRRRGAIGPLVPSSSEAGLTAEPQTSQQQQRSPDPLHWFGGLVPPVLREAQHDFSIALSTAVDLATAVALLEASQREYAACARDDLSQVSTSIDPVQTDFANSDSGTTKSVDADMEKLEAKFRVNPESIGTTTLMEELAVKYGAIT